MALLVPVKSRRYPFSFRSIGQQVTPAHIVEQLRNKAVRLALKVADAAFWQEFVLNIPGRRRYNEFVSRVREQPATVRGVWNILMLMEEYANTYGGFAKALNKYSAEYHSLKDEVSRTLGELGVGLGKPSETKKPGRMEVPPSLPTWLLLLPVGAGLIFLLRKVLRK